jgi:hypothetical protein
MAVQVVHGVDVLVIPAAVVVVHATVARVVVPSPVITQ